MKTMNDFVNRNRLPGWYIDVLGSYCYGNGKFLISVFVDSDDNTYNITVDRIEGVGKITNYEWEFVSVDDESAEEFILEHIGNFINEYINK